jgi:hypothetical protein
VPLLGAALQPGADPEEPVDLHRQESINLTLSDGTGGVLLGAQATAFLFVVDNE